MKRNIGTHTYDEVGNGRTDGHDHVRAVRGPQRTTRRTELASKDLKGERGFEHERYETEGERHARHYEHEQAWGRAQHAIVATFFWGGGDDPSAHSCTKSSNGMLTGECRATFHK